MDMSELDGQVFKFYGVDNLRFKLGPTVYEAVEDQEDGYRSCLEELLEVPTSKSDKGGIFFGTRLALVRVVLVEEHRGFQGFVLVDEVTGHEWLKVGTDYGEEWYPCFVFDYTPDRSQIINS